MSTLKYLLILFTSFAVSHLFFSLLEKAEHLPPWLTPLRGALLVTFMIQLWIVIKFTQNAMPIDAP